MIKKYLKLNYNYFFVPLGFLLIILFIWFRFLRARMPRDIPFTLVVLGFIIIIINVILYTYIIFRLFKPKKMNTIIQEMVKTLCVPLEEFDTLLKKNISLEEILSNSIKINYTIYQIFFIANTIPRILITITFAMDVLLFNCFHYIYTTMIIGIIPLMSRYFIYSLNKMKNFLIVQYSSQIRSINTPYVINAFPEIDKESEEDGMFPDTVSIPLDEFIQYQTDCILYRNQPAEYNIYRPEEIYEEYKHIFNVKELESEHFDHIELKAKKEVEKILQFSLFIAKYQAASGSYKSIKIITLFSYIIYLICWLYVVLLSLHNVQWITGLISLIHTLVLMEDPFSGQELFTDLVNYINNNKELFMQDIIKIR